MPSGQIHDHVQGWSKKVSAEELLGGKTVVLFSVPGAFTPTCDAKHLPGSSRLADEIKKKGVDHHRVHGRHDVFVMNAWGKLVASATKS